MAKSNKKFMVASALGIIMVVDAHAWSVLPLFTNIIPYNSFFMPLFVFISGYFNRVDADTDLVRHIRNRAVKLFVPYCLISFVCFIFEMMFYPDFVFPFDVFYVADNIIRVFTEGSVVSVAFPLWFVPALFFTDIIYSIIMKFANRKYSIFILSVLIAVHLLAVFVSKNGYVNDLSLLLSKVCFFLVFMHAGHMFNGKIEETLSRANKPLLLVVLLLINIAREMYLPSAYDVAFNAINYMSGFTSPFIITPLISSFIGILFWLTMIDWIGKSLYDKKIINYISDNTFWIMGFHILFFCVLNRVLYLIDSIYPLNGFDADQCLHNISYLWTAYDQFRFVYFLAGIGGALITKYVFDHIRAKVMLKSVEKK